MKFDLTILGSNSATPIYNRNPSAQILNINEKLYLIDCGEGTQQQMLKFDVKASRIDFIFISHLHGDHYFGLLGLLSSLHLNGRNKSIKIFGPKPLKEIIDLQFNVSETKLQYEIEYNFTNPNEPEIILDNNDVIVETIPLVHGIPCTGFLFREKKRLRKLIKEKVSALNIPTEFFTAIKKGADYIDNQGVVFKNDSITLDSAIPKTYCYCSDTCFSESYFKQISNATILYHESTFLHNMLDRAKITQHTTVLQAAEVALKTNAKMLLIGHFSARYKTLNELLEEAKSVFPNTELAIEGKTFQIGDE